MKHKLMILLSVLILLTVLVFPMVCARQEMVLLAIAGSSGDEKGSTADLIIDIEPGSGRVFIDTYPLTKLDTQISVRSAKEIACDYLNMDCNRYDFFYTIHSDSVIIGGPSAGTALTMLTIAELKGWKIDDKASVTGTINPGGFVGSVGGITHKVMAAKESGLTKVLIPKGSVAKLSDFIELEEESSTEDNGNISRQQDFPKVNISVPDENTDDGTQEDEEEIDVFEYAKENGIELVEVVTLDEVIYEFTGVTFEREEIEINANENYVETMDKIRQDLCGRTKMLLPKIQNTSSLNYEVAKNQSERADIVANLGSHYSAASFCFSANIRLNDQLLVEKGFERDDILERAAELQKNITSFDNFLEGSQLKTMTALQTYIVVKERLIEAEEELKKVFDNLKENNTRNAIYHLAYADERFQSGHFWSRFLMNPGTEFDMGEDALRESCTMKISEAEERYQYANLYIPGSLTDTRNQLDKAYLDKEKGKYELCLFKASKAKAEANLMLGALGLKEETIHDYLDIKLRLTEDTIQRQQNKGIFPILGYSYYEYAQSLSESDKYSSLLYAEYALELSNLDFYFSDSVADNLFRPSLSIDWEIFYNFVFGCFFGVSFTLFFFWKKIIKKDDGCLSIKINKKR